MSRSLWRVSKNPLLLLVVSGLLTAFLAPFITGKWQNHQQALRDRSALAQLMSQSSADIISATQAREFHPSDAQKVAFVAAFQAWDEQSQVVSAQIASYDVPHRASLTSAWHIYSLAMLCFYDLPGRTGKTDSGLRNADLDALSAYLDREGYPVLRDREPPDLDSNQKYQQGWRRLKFDLIRKRDEIVSGVLRGTPVDPRLDVKNTLFTSC